MTTSSEFEFSTRATLKKVWPLFKKHAWYFVGLSLVMLVFNVFSQKNDNILFNLVVFLASMLWSYVAVSSALAAVDGKEGMLRFDAIKLHFPSGKQFLLLIGLTFVSAIIMLVGFVALILPGIYFMVRLLFSNFALVDRKEGIKASLRFSWHLVKGDIFWTVLLALMVVAVLMVLGFIALGVGILVTYPLGILFLAVLYRELCAHHQKNVTVVQQPQEITPPVTPQVPPVQ